MRNKWLHLCRYSISEPEALEAQKQRLLVIQED